MNRDPGWKTYVDGYAEVCKQALRNWLNHATTYMPWHPIRFQGSGRRLKTSHRPKSRLGLYYELWTCCVTWLTQLVMSYYWALCEQTVAIFRFKVLEWMRRSIAMVCHGDGDVSNLSSPKLWLLRWLYDGSPQTPRYVGEAALLSRVHVPTY